MAYGNNVDRKMKKREFQGLGKGKRGAHRKKF